MCRQLHRSILGPVPLDAQERLIGLRVAAKTSAIEDQQDFIEINARLAKVWPVITARKDALPDAEKFNGEPNKRELLIEK